LQAAKKLNKQLSTFHVKGGTKHPMELHKRFRGHEPKVKALLKRAGLV
jgi:Zn-dependent oligopeptidase